MPRRGIDLTEDQWRLAKSTAAKRGQTLSEYFADMLTAGPGSKPMTDRHVPVNTSIDSRYTTGIRPGEPSSTGTVSDPSFGASRPAPKPVTKR